MPENERERELSGVEAELSIDGDTVTFVMTDYSTSSVEVVSSVFTNWKDAEVAFTLLRRFSIMLSKSNGKLVGVEDLYGVDEIMGRMN